MTLQPRRTHTCSLCGGPAYRRGNLSLSIRDDREMEDTDQPLLHLRNEDWTDNPHNVVEVES